MWGFSGSKKKEGVAKPVQNPSEPEFDWKEYAADPANREKIAEEIAKQKQQTTVAKPAKSDFVSESVSAIKKRKKELEEID